MIYVRNIFFSCDQLLNTSCGGDPDITISARVGYFSKIVQWNSQPKNLKKYYWKPSEKPAILVEFNFLRLEPKKPEGIELLYCLSKEYSGESVLKEHRGE